MEKNATKSIEMHKAHRRNKKIRLASISLALLLIGTIMITAFFKYSKNEYNSYTENAKANYKVKLKENDFYPEEYLDEQNTMIASLIEHIDVNFNYKLQFEQKQDYSYSYKIVAKTTVKEGTRANSIYETTEDLIEKEIQKMNNSDSLEIDEHFSIDYNQYNNKINKFIGLYNLDDTTSTLDLEMYVYAKNKYDDQQINKSSKVMSLNIPLTTKTINIGISTNVIKDDGKILIQKSQYENAENILYIGTAVLALGIIVMIAFIKYVIDTRSAEKMYEQELKKILFNYKSYIQKANNPINEEEYKIIKINTFNEILGLRDTVQAPILMYTEENVEKTKFMIINEGILYVYVLGAKEIREELRARHAEKMKNK